METMATRQLHVVQQSVPVDVPDNREYESEKAADLDRELCGAIEAAAAVNDEYLVGVLANELGSHYYKTRD